MPSSSPEAVPTVVNVAYTLSPRRILDVGCGSGKYGVLYREYLELQQSDEDSDFQNPIAGEHHITIDGIEGHAPYIGSLHHLVYDHIFQEDILDFVKRDFEYDLIFMGDVLEHIDKGVAETTLLPRLVERATMGVLISVPAHVREQDAVFGNEYERHRSSWKPRDFRPFAPYVYTGLVGKHLVAFLSTNQESYERIHPGSTMRRIARTVKRSYTELFHKTW